ncbi:MAG: GYD domain-containing protein [Syntrophorhabdales bacterium]
MPNYYITLYKLTDQGIKEIKSAPQRIEANRKALDAAGGKMIGLYATMGEYDYVSVIEVPTDEDAMTGMLGMGSAGSVRTTTLKAFSMEQFAQMVKKLP